MITDRGTDLLSFVSNIGLDILLLKGIYALFSEQEVSEHLQHGQIFIFIFAQHAACSMWKLSADGDSCAYCAYFCFSIFYALCSRELGLGVDSNT